MSFLIPFAIKALPLLKAVGATVGIATGVKSLVGGGKSASAQEAAPEPKPLPSAPKPEDAAKKAESEVTRRRRISLLSGGRTNITRGRALVPESAIERKSLLGE